ncbi:MAG: MFS transporter [Sedimentisphaerales bacterium]|nr:MFS transporter [Sedimentisphaerales bacterium]
MSDTELPKAATNQPRRSMNCSIVTAITTVIGEVCLGGHILVLIALKFGAGSSFLGLLSFAALAPLSCLVFTMKAVERIGKRKILIQWYSVAILFVLPFMFLPVLGRHWPGWLCLWLILIVTLLRSLTNAFGNAGWWPLLQDIVPTNITGRFFARLRTYWQSAWLIVALGSALLLRDKPDWWKFEIIFAAALLAYLVRVLSIIPIVERPLATGQSGQRSILSHFIEVIQNKPLRLLVIYLVIYMAGVTIAEPFKIKMLKDSGCSYGLILAATSMVPLGAIVMLRFWGRLADRFGNRIIFSLSHIAMIIVSTLWVVASVNTFNVAFIFALYFFWSLFDCGSRIAQTRYIMHVVPRDKQNQINVINLWVWLTMACAPLFGGFFLHIWEHLQSAPTAGSLQGGYSVLFAVSAMLFVPPFILRKKLRSKKDMPTAYVVALAVRPLRNIFGPFIMPTKKTLGKSTPL